MSPHIARIVWKLSLAYAWWNSMYRRIFFFHYCQFKNPRTSGSGSGFSMHLLRWFLRQGEAITSPRFWLDCTGSPSWHKLHSRSHFWPSRRSRRKTWISRRDSRLPSYPKDPSFVLEKPSACKRCQTVFASHGFRHATPSIWSNLPTHLTDLSLTQESLQLKLKT